MTSAITVRYPTWEWFISVYPGMAGASAWYHYLLTGLRELYTVVIDEGQDARSVMTKGTQLSTLQIEAGGKTWTAVYDWSDFVQIPTLAFEVDAYYKIMCRRWMVDERGVRPIGQTLAAMNTLRILERLRELRATHGEMYDVSCLGRATNWEMRVDAVRLLRALGGRQLTGVSPYPRRPDVPDDVKAERMPRADYMNATALSAVVVAMPGVGGDWTWRHTEALALGACMVCPAGDFVMPGHSTDCWVTCKRDLSDLQAIVSGLLSDPERSMEIGRRGRDYFDAELTPVAMARRLVTGTMET
jgi:hypothetical protein